MTNDNAIAEALHQLEIKGMDTWTSAENDMGPYEIAALSIMGKSPNVLRTVMESFPAQVPVQIVYRRWKGVMTSLGETP